MGNYIPNGGGSQGGGRQTALLPQRARRFHSGAQVLTALSEGFRGPKYAPVHRFQLFAQQDGERFPVYEFPVADPLRIEEIIQFAKERNLAILYQGVVFLKREAIRQLKENRKKVYQTVKDKQKAIEEIAKLDLQALSGEDKWVRLAHWVVIDIDCKDEAVWRLIEHLQKLNIFPEVWETRRGYHIYIHFYLAKEYGERKVKDEEGNERIERYEKGYILPYANNRYIRSVEESLKVLCAKHGIKPDFVSATHAVWLEGVPNPIKDGFATKLILEGEPLPLLYLWERLLWVNPPQVFQKPSYKVRPKDDTDGAEEARRELHNLLSGEHSSAFHALSQHGTLIACKKLLEAGYDLLDIKHELRRNLNIRKKSDEKVLQKFLDHFEKNYTKPTNKQESTPKEKEHKHEHWEELAVRVIEAWKNGYQKISHIAKYLGVTRGKIYHLRVFLQEHGYEWEHLFTKSEEVLAFLKAHRKGGNKTRKVWDKKAWIKERKRKIEEYKRRMKEESRTHRAKKRAEMKSKGMDPDRWKQAPVQFLPVGGVRIGYLVCKGGDGSSSTNRPIQSTKTDQRREAFKTPAVPLVLPNGLTSSLQEALFDLLKKHHSEDGLPVVLVVPKRVSTVRGTLLQLTPYKVPPRSFKQLWKEIREKFGKLVQGLSTKNGALNWFLRAWEKLKEDPRGWIVVGSSPFSSKKNLSSSELSKLLSLQAELSNKLLEKLSTLQTEPSYKLSEGAKSSQSLKLALPIGEFATLENLFKAHSDKKIAELMPYMSEKSRQLFEQVQLVLKKEFATLHKLKEKGELNSALSVVEKTESIIRLLEDRFLGLLSLSSVIFHRFLETVLRHIEKICKDEMLFSGWESLTATDLLRKLSSADTYDEFLQASTELRKKLSTEQQTFLEFLTDIDLIREKMHGQPQEKLSAKKKANKKSGFPSSQVIKTVIKSFEDMNQGKGVIVVSRQELETAIYSAWINADKEKANRLAVSEYIDKFEGVLWKKLNNGHYCLLVSSDQVITRIRDYVRELKQAKKNGQGQTSADGNGSVGSELLTHNGNNGNGKPSVDGHGSLGSTSLPTNGNGKYEIDQIIHTLRKEGKVYVPPQFLHEIVRELKRAGLSVSYWTTTGLIELAGGDDELPF
jgi:ribosomal protein S6